MKSIIPRGQFVLIKPDDVDKTTKSGIFIPDNIEQETKDYGEVLAISNDLIDKDNAKFDTDLKVGDKVIYSKYAGERIDDNGEIFILIDEKEILAIII